MNLVGVTKGLSTSQNNLFDVGIKQVLHISSVSQTHKYNK